METIGTKPEEKNSYETVITLLVSGTVGIVLCSLLEMVFYFLYSLKVWRVLITKIIHFLFEWNSSIQLIWLSRSQRISWKLKVLVNQLILILYWKYVNLISIKTNFTPRVNSWPRGRKYPGGRGTWREGKQMSNVNISYQIYFYRKIRRLLRVRNFNFSGRQWNRVVKSISWEQIFNEVILLVICISKCHHLIRYLVEWNKGDIFSSSYTYFLNNDFQTMYCNIPSLFHVTLFKIFRSKWAPIWALNNCPV